MYRVCCWNTEKCYLYNNHEYGVYRLRSRVYLQYHHKCRILYYLCCCLRRRLYLSDRRLYCIGE